MSDTITITGNLAADPEQRMIGNGTTVTRFRVGSSQRRLDRNTGKWVETMTNWYDVSAFRALGEHAFASLRRGERVIVSGKLKVRSWENEKGRGMSVEIEADAVGHDLRWGTTRYARAERGDQWSAAGEDAAGADSEPSGAESAGAEAREGEPADRAPDGREPELMDVPF